MESNEAQPETAGRELATIGDRFLALLIDGMIVAAITFLVGMGLVGVFPNAIGVPLIVMAQTEVLSSSSRREQGKQIVDSIERVRTTDVRGVMTSDCVVSRTTTISGAIKTSFAVKKACSYGAVDGGTLIFPVVLIYGTFFTMRPRGATLGKRTMQIEVVAVTGEKIGLGRSILRNVAELALGIFVITYVVALFTKRKQALHDLVARTLVVKRLDAAA